MRFHYGVRQIHMSDRKLTENELRLLPDELWVDEYFMDNKWSNKSWIKQYEKQKFSTNKCKGGFCCLHSFRCQDDYPQGCHVHYIPNELYGYK